MRNTIPTLESEGEKVRRDALNEYISVETARNVYGVVMDPETFQVDLEATAELRAGKKAE